MITFEEAFGVKFGDNVQGSGLTCDLSTFNPKMKGNAMLIEVFDDAMRPMNASHVGVSPDGIEFDTASNYYNRFVSFFAWNVNIRTRLWNLKRKHGTAYFPFAGFARTIRDKAIPKQRPLAEGDTFYITCTDEHGESVTLSAVFRIPNSASYRAKLSRKRNRAEVFYSCRY